MIGGYYLIHMLILVCIYIILTVSLNLALGFTGLLNLGHVAFFGLGAYTSALLTISGVPFFIAMLSGALLASGCGYLLVLATRKLKGDYLALATLGFAFVAHSLFLNWVALTRGPLGIPGIPKPTILGFHLVKPELYLILAFVIMTISIFIIHRILQSPFGRLLQATRDDALGLQVLGKNTFKLKAKAMMLSAFFAGIAGSLFAHYITYIDPSSFTLTEIVLMLTILIVGGIASIKGSIVATFIILLIPETLRFLSLPSSVIGPGRQILYALVLLAILLYNPRGLFGRIDLEDA
ncbi:branched-chain amino acid ABC transporter permease [Candidatus Woesearchaeota archaeon]|nr:branched-chain amino acid ABC transporter permease [Candidatus Woesearchaeota archaeon]